MCQEMDDGVKLLISLFLRGPTRNASIYAARGRTMSVILFDTPVVFGIASWSKGIIQRALGWS